MVTTLTDQIMRVDSLLITVQCGTADHLYDQEGMNLHPPEPRPDLVGLLGDR